MKKTILISIAACAAFISCSKVDTNEVNNDVFVIQATIESDAAKSVIDDESLEITWTAGDQINLFFEDKSYTLWTEESGKSVSFSCTGIVATPGDGSYLWGVYPRRYSNTFDGNSITMVLPAEQKACENTFTQGICPQIAKTLGHSMSFMNVGAFVRFTVTNSDICRVTLKGNNGEPIAGKAKVGFSTVPEVSEYLEAATEVSMSAPSGTSFVPGTSYYFVLYPQDFTNGITLTYEKTDGSTADYVTSAFTLERRVRANVIGRDNGLPFTIPYVDLSAAGTANCYIVPKAGHYKFKAATGNLNSTITSLSSVEVLWESFGTDVKPEVGDLIQASVSYADDYIFFSTNREYKEGNAVIAARNSSGTILWSWHIWMTEDAIEEQVYNRGAGTFMDRNLGATSATKGEVGAIGLLYEWGRKDPFLGSSNISAPVVAESTITWPAAHNRSSRNDDLPISYSVEHPTTYICSTAGYWYTDWTSEDYKGFTRWNQTKTKYDPCPAGWRVPGSSEGSPWRKVLGTDWYGDIFASWDSVNKGIDFAIGNLFGSGSIWYPASGLRNEGSGELDASGQGSYWTVNQKVNNFALIMNIHYEDDGYYVYNGSQGSLTTGSSVRCIKE